MQDPNQPIWFTSHEKKGNVREVHLGTSPHRIMVCTPVHSDVSMHYCQAVLKFQQQCINRNMLCSFNLRYNRYILVDVFFILSINTILWLELKRNMKML